MCLAECWLREQNLSHLTAEEMSELKGRGFSDAQIGRLTGHTMMAVRARRKALGVLPSYKRVDTCAAEFDVSCIWWCPASWQQAVPPQAPEVKVSVLIILNSPARFASLEEQRQKCSSRLQVEAHVSSSQ